MKSCFYNSQAGAFKEQIRTKGHFQQTRALWTGYLEHNGLLDTQCNPIRIMLNKLLWSNYIFISCPFWKSNKPTDINCLTRQTRPAKLISWTTTLNQLRGNDWTCSLRKHWTYSCWNKLKLIQGYHFSTHSYIHHFSERPKTIILLQKWYIPRTQPCKYSVLLHFI